MGQELQVPAIFQQKGMAKAFQGQVNPHDDNLADGIGQSYPVIAYKGKIWALRHRGERKIVTRPDDGSPSGHLDVVILGQAKSKSKSFYKKYDPSTSEGERPICASIDGIVPDADVTAKQSDTCALCTRNVWKVDPDTGRKGRECTDYKRLAVLVMPTQSQAALGSPLVEPMFLRVPPDSLNSLAIMGDTMSNQGFHYSTYWTRISFDPVKAHPCMVFRPLQPVRDDEAPVILEMRNSSTVGRITGGEVALQGPKLIQSMEPAGSVASGLTAPVTTGPGMGAQGTAAQRQQPARQQQIGEPDVTEANTGLGALGPDPRVVKPGNSEGPKRGRPVGSKNVPKVEQAAAPQEPVQESLSLGSGGNGQSGDAGIADASDDELDAEIAKLISR